MAERELVEYIRKLAAASTPDWLRVPIGDDAAVLDVPDGGPLVVTTDGVIEGVHFEPGTAPALVGRKAIARCLSDLAAMAARPLCTVAAVAFGPHTGEEDRHDLLKALWRTAREMAATLVGGDVAASPGPTSVTVTALGTPGPGGILRRAGARPGDAVCVTGELGGSIRGRHLRFSPRIDEALDLAQRLEVHAMVDVSDGLSTDALHLAEAGRVGLTLRAADFPVSADAVALAGESGLPAWRHALEDGEDYELLFCIPPDRAPELARFGALGTPVTVIGQVTDGPSRLVLPDGAEEALLARGWEHLR